MSIPSQQYATPTDLANLALGAQALSVITTDEQNAALLSASQQADGFLNAKFVLPLLSWGTDLKRTVCQIAAYDLLTARGYNPETGGNVNIRDRYLDARRWLEQVAADKINPIVVDSSIPQSPTGQPDGQAGATGFSFSVGAPINQPGGFGFMPGGGVLNFWNNSAAATFNARGTGGRTRGF